MSRSDLTSCVSLERSLVCRMHSSRALRLQNTGCCSMLVRGRFRPDAALFVALCSPTVDRLKDSELLRASACFQTLHRPDMRLTHAPCRYKHHRAGLSDSTDLRDVGDMVVDCDEICFHSVWFHLGFSAEELIGRSWYELLHPEDLTLAAGCHHTLSESKKLLFYSSSMH